MEHLISTFPALFAFFLFIFMVLRIWKRSRTKNSNMNLPPTPWKLPLIGNMHHLMGGLPHRRLRDLAKIYGPLMHLQLGELSTIVVSSPEAAKEVLKTNDLSFAQRPRLLAMEVLAYGHTNISFSPYGDYWRQMRKICVTEMLSQKRVESFRSIREEEVSNLIRFISSHAGSQINLSKEIFALTSRTVSRVEFGKIGKDLEEYTSLLREAVELIGGFAIADVFPSLKWLRAINGERTKLEKLHKKLDRIVGNVVSEHKAKKARAHISESEPDRDLVDILLNFQNDSGLGFSLTDDNIKAVIQDIFAAGSDTSSTTIEWAMSQMLKHPRVMEKAQAEVRGIFGEKGIVDETGLHELNFLKLVIKETLRLHPPAPLLVPRECMETSTIFGHDIPSKSNVIINAWAIGRDSNHWNDADRFHPERFLDSSIDYKGANFELIPFGSGRRMCPGMTFGMTNVELPLANLLFHFDWKLQSGTKIEELDMLECFGLTVKRKNDLLLIPILFDLVQAHKTAGKDGI